MVGRARTAATWSSNSPLRNRENPAMNFTYEDRRNACKVEVKNSSSR